MAGKTSPGLNRGNPSHLNPPKKLLLRLTSNTSKLGQMNRRIFWVGLGWVGFSISACSQEPLANPEGARDVAQQNTLSAEEAAKSTQLQQGRRQRFLRNIPPAPISRLEDREKRGRTPPRPYPYDNSGDPKLVAKWQELNSLIEPVGEEEFSVIMGDGETGEEYQVTQTLEGLRVADLFARSLGHRGDAAVAGAKPEPLSTSEPGIKPQTIVGGSDNRTSFAIGASYPSNAWPHRTITRIVTNTMGASSGTLIGNRLVLVSAHGTIDQNGIIDWPDIVPRQDTASPAPPYGVVGAYTYVYPTAWVTNGCSLTTGSSVCDFYDWVVLILWPTPFGSNHPGWMGYAAGSDAALQGWFHYTKGFPGCGGYQSPSPCTWGQMFGDYGDDPVLSDVASGWPYYGIYGRLSHKTDWSEGQSGGAVYSYDPGSNGPYVIATSIANAVISGTGGVGPRISGTLVSYFNSLRTSYP